VTQAMCTRKRGDTERAFERAASRASPARRPSRSPLPAGGAPVGGAATSAAGGIQAVAAPAPTPGPHMARKAGRLTQQRRPCEATVPRTAGRAPRAALPGPAAPAPGSAGSERREQVAQLYYRRCKTAAKRRCGNTGGPLCPPAAPDESPRNYLRARTVARSGAAAQPARRGCRAEAAARKRAASGALRQGGRRSPQQ
jgi:hypothetical protein